MSKLLEPQADPAHTTGLDFASLRLSQDYTQMAGVEKMLTTVPVRKPIKTEFIRVHPERRFDLMLLELKEDREAYVVAPGLLAELSGLAAPVSLRLCINRQRVLFLWPLRLPGADGRTNPWHESAWEAVELASKRWTSLRANMSLGAYEIFQGAEALSEPEWPNKTMEEILQIAFRNRFIDNIDHPVLRRLRGEV